MSNEIMSVFAQAAAGMQRSVTTCEDTTAEEPEWVRVDAQLDADGNVTGYTHHSVDDPRGQRS